MLTFDYYLTLKLNYMQKITAIEMLRAFNNLTGVQPIGYVNAVFGTQVTAGLRSHLSDKLTSKCRKYTVGKNPVETSLAGIYDFVCELDGANSAIVNEYILRQHFCDNQKEHNTGLTLIVVPHTGKGVKSAIEQINKVCTAIADTATDSAEQSFYQYAATTIGRVYNAYPINEM